MPMRRPRPRCPRSSPTLCDLSNALSRIYRLRSGLPRRLVLDRKSGFLSQACRHRSSARMLGADQFCRMHSDMTYSLLNLRRNEGWAGLAEGARRDHYFRSDRQHSLCGGVIVLSAIGALTPIGGNKSCCRSCNDLHASAMKRIAALLPERPEEQPGWVPRGGTQKRHFFGLAASPQAVRTSLCRNAILLRSINNLRPGYDFNRHNCFACWQISRRGVVRCGAELGQD